MRGPQMATVEELREIRWPSEFVVEYLDGSRERLLRGDGVHILAPGDDPEGFGALMAVLPKKHHQNQKQGARYVRFTELRAVHSTDGHLLWPKP